jgi:hypothetical protein
LGAGVGRRGGGAAVSFYGELCGRLLAAAASIALTFLFILPDERAHLLLTVILAGFVGLLIFLIAAMDRPFRGEVSIGPEAFEAVRQQMPAGAAASPGMRGITVYSTSSSSVSAPRSPASPTSPES